MDVSLKNKVRELWAESTKAESALLRSIGMKPCGPRTAMPGDLEAWWYLPDETDDGQAYERREACRLILAGVRITS